MNKQYEQLFSQLGSGPSVLLMGQDLLRRYAGEDYFLTTCQSRFGLSSADDYSDLIANCSDDETTMAMLHNISSRIAVPESMDLLASLPWNCVLTSSFHDVLDRALGAAEWRQLQPVIDGANSPSDPRNKLRLCLFKLYGCVTREKDSEWPPMTRLQKLQRDSIASEMLSDLHSVVTPKGTLVIDSLAANDWLQRDTLVQAVSRLGVGQVHLFNATDEDLNHVGLQLLQEEERVCFHRDSFAEALGKVSKDSVGKLFGEGKGWTDGVQLTLPSGKKHTFSPSDWRRLTNGLVVLSDDDASKQYQFNSDDERYRRFKDFLYGTHGVPDWQAFASGMAFRRSEFNTLQKIVHERLERQRLNEKPILIVGQSGTGKSVALAELAVMMRKKNWPVVYFGRNESDIDAEVVSALATDLDGMESTPLLLIWDASVGPDSFASLTNLFASHGRKVVVVGAAYQESDKAVCVPFSEIMQHEDAERFLDHLKSFDESLVAGISPKDFERRNFWAWLWRLLPESRGQLRLGLLSEAENYFQSLEHSFREQAVQAPVAQGTLGALLQQAGIDIVQSDQTEKMNLRNARGEAASKVETLSGLILVPGSFGEDVPVDLVLRCLGREGFPILQTALKNVPVFRWSEDDRGNHLLGARQQIEASVFVWSTFSKSEQFDFMLELLGSVQARGDWRQFNPEVTFALNLLRSIGPDSTRGTTGAELVTLADVVKKIIDQSGANINPWLAFQEGYLRREALKHRRGEINWKDVVSVSSGVNDFMGQYSLAAEALERAETAYGTTSDPKLNRRLSQIHTEYAGLCGIAQDLQNRVSEMPESDGVLSHVAEQLRFGYEDAVRHCKKAVRLDTENVYSLDVQFRVIKNELSLTQQQGEVPTDVHAEMVSELCDVLGNEAWDLSPDYFGQRKLEFADIIGDSALRTEALKELADAGSFAGEYLLAWKNIYYADRQWRPDHEIDEALGRIESLQSVDDAKLLRLYTNAWWHRFAKADLFDRKSERKTVRLSSVQWEHYAKWLSKRVRKHDDVSPRTQFLYAWALFQIGDFAESGARFKQLDQSVFAGAFRVVRLALWSDEDGKPVVCSGTIRRMSEGRKGWVYVPALRKTIPFQPSDFKSEKLFVNQPLPEFHIAFNFRGALADPARNYSAKGRE